MRKLTLFIIAIFGATMHPCLAGTSIPYRIDYGGWFTISVTVNGQGPYDFIIDSGSTKSLVFDKLNAIHNFQLSGGLEQRVLGTGSEDTFPTFAIGDIQIGSEKISGLETVILKDWAVDGVSPSGVIGLDFLARFNVVFDLENKTVSFDDEQRVKIPSSWHQSDLKRDSYGLKSGDLFTLQGRVESRRVTFLLDLGASGTIINGTAYGSLSRPPRISIRPTGAEAIGRVKDALNSERIARQARIRRFRIGKLYWYNTLLTVFDAPIFKDLGKRGVPYGLFGSDFLVERSFAIDFLNDEIHIGPKYSE